MRRQRALVLNGGPVASRSVNACTQAAAAATHDCCSWRFSRFEVPTRAGIKFTKAALRFSEGGGVTGATCEACQRRQEKMRQESPQSPAATHGRHGLLAHREAHRTHLLHVSHSIVIRQTQLKPLQQPHSGAVRASGIKHIVADQVKHVDHHGGVLPQDEESAAGEPLELDVFLMRTCHVTRMHTQ